MRHARVRRFLVAAVLTITATAGLASPVGEGQPPPERPAPEQRGGAPGGGGPTIAAIEREFDRLEIFEARRALGLSEAAFRDVMPHLQRIQLMRRRQLHQRRAILAELRAALESGSVETHADGTAARLVELGALGVRHAQELRRAHLALDAVLSVRQRAEYRLFQERFERRKLDLLARARQARSGAPPGRPPR
ncbi:MAG TPA: hypothetical protein VMM93_10070 [Vicinamibacterales bacterium]|nr:hypothetical protein [Vicinamibacterales bacterium]